jgi:hypothetical protein
MPNCRARDYSNADSPVTAGTNLEGTGTKYSMAIDMLTIDQFNDFVYGLIVARDTS